MKTRLIAQNAQMKTNPLPQDGVDIYRPNWNRRSIAKNIQTERRWLEL